jgi:hypothetical protein
MAGACACSMNLVLPHSGALTRHLAGCRVMVNLRGGVYRQGTPRPYPASRQLDRVAKPARAARGGGRDRSVAA